jgi:hypothetical protein
MATINLTGSPLDERDYQMLERCFISRELADQALLRGVSDIEGRTLIGANGRHGDYSGIAIPNIDPANGNIRDYRLRRDRPDLEQRNGRVVEEAKYLSAPGARNRAYFPPGTRPEWLKDSSIPIVLLEGEKKCLALWRVAWNGLGDAAERPVFLPLGLSGVWNWRGVIGKAPTPDGGRRAVRGVIADLINIVWAGRDVTTFFDTNVQTNENVCTARQHLSGWLAGQGARVRLANLPIEEGINGPDDAAGKHGAQYVLNIIEQAVAFESAIPPIVLSSAEEEIVRNQPCAGFLQEYVSYARACLHEAPPDYHTVTALAVMAGVLGGKLRTDTGLTPNLAILIVGLQGHGKSLPMTASVTYIRSATQAKKIAILLAASDCPSPQVPCGSPCGTCCWRFP